MVYGIGAEVKDPDGWVWALVEALDGSLTVDEVVGKTSARFPELPGDAIRQAITDLQAAGFIDDARADVPEGFSEQERIRYSRGVPLMRWMDLSPRTNAWEIQQELRAAKVLLVGVGGTGGYAAHGLVASGVGHLHCVDSDVVELSNLNRQPLFREGDIGKGKVDAAVAALREVNSHVRVTGARCEISGPDDLAELLAMGTPGEGAGFDLLVLAADRPPVIRGWANRVCLDRRLPWVAAGYEGPQVLVGVHVPYRGACWECLQLAERDRVDLRVAPGQGDDVASARMPWNPVTAVTAGLSGGLLTHAALSLLTGVPALEPGLRFGMNLMALEETITLRSPRRDDCPACGTDSARRDRVAAHDRVG
ncbi:HesA/MoeB/ThiF family protein [Streptomyces sp. HNM1019]|uniref:HesA/MoeB/ThiF family protein n=1 Tax=Streptomyces sp. HNM1019 TaxID=3424717 RepID=UPI003D76DCF2